MVHLNKYRSPTATQGKIHYKKFGPYPITKKINANSYILELSSDMKISSTFNVLDLYSYYPPNAAPMQVLDSGLNPFEERCSDAGA